MKPPAPTPRFFPTPDHFRRWLEKHHTTATELFVGFYKTGSGKPSITWPESVDEALCVGWIDGVRKRIDDESYVIRFTPRKPSSIWSAINIKKMDELIRQRRVGPAGIKAFEMRTEKKSGIYSYEQRESAKFSDEFEQLFRANAAAWEHFQAQAPWYRRTTTFWVMTAKQEATRLRRLAILIEACATGKPVPELKHASKRK